MAQKKYYYIGVMDNEEGMKFVTGFDKQSKMPIWVKNKKPLALTQQLAEHYAEALVANLVPATVVITFCKLDKQPCWVTESSLTSDDQVLSIFADVIKNVERDTAQIKEVFNLYVLATKINKMNNELERRCISEELRSNTITEEDRTELEKANL